MNEFLEKMVSDVNYWQNMKPPMAPSEKDVEIYKKLIAKRTPVYLLGMTKELVPLCDVAVDLTPLDIGKPTIKSDWNDLSGFYAGAIIGDGVLNLNSLDLVWKLLKISDCFICRVFTKKPIWAKYATYFPNQFPDSKIIIPTDEDISIVMWEK